MNTTSLHATVYLQTKEKSKGKNKYTMEKKKVTRNKN